MKYTENQLEQIFITLLETERYQYKMVSKLSRYEDLEEIELESLNITKILG